MRAAKPRGTRPAWLARRLCGLRRLLGRCVQVKRVDKRLQLVFDAEALLPTGSSRAVARERAEARTGLPEPSDSELARMRSDLADLLGFHPAARSVFPSLVLVERALGRRKARALERLPGEVLIDASTLLARLAGDWSSDGVSMLRARLSRLLAARVEPEGAANAGGSVQVEEGSLSAFMELDREWEQQLHRPHEGEQRQSSVGHR